MLYDVTFSHSAQHHRQTYAIIMPIKCKLQYEQNMYSSAPSTHTNNSWISKMLITTHYWNKTKKNKSKCNLSHAYIHVAAAAYDDADEII